MKKTVVLLCILVLIAFSYGVVSAASPDKDVVVTNTSSNPVPVAGNVAITGTTNVNVTNTVPVSVSGVVSVQNVDQPSMQPFQDYIQCRPTGSYSYSCDTYTVPQNTRLIIEQVGISFVPNDPTTNVASVSFGTIASGHYAEHGIEPPAAKTFRGTFTVQRGSRLTKIYADAGTTIFNFSVLINKDSTPLNEQMIIITLSGQKVLE
jgi:hypothetical protein